MEENGVTDRQTEVKDSVIHSPRLFGEWVHFIDAK